MVFGGKLGWESLQRVGDRQGVDGDQPGVVVERG